jgi:CRISPR-associated protein Csb2
VIGDGRWLGLGVMRRVQEGLARAANGTVGLHVFAISGGSRLRWSDTEAITGALRRAVMARAQVTAGARLKRGESLPSFFTGHPQGVSTEQLANGHHEHLFYALDAGQGVRPGRLMIIAPHRGDRSAEVPRQTRGFLGWLDEALEGLTDLRAGRLGRFELAHVEPDADDRVLGRSAVWTSLTPYHPTRHPKRGQDASDCVVDDLLREADRRGLRRPAVDVLELEIGPRGGLRARLRLRFAVALEGPLLLGKESHFGAGLFGRAKDEE